MPQQHGSERTNGSVVASLLLDTEDPGSNPACGGRTVCPCACKDDLWWTDSLTTDRNRVTQHNGGSSMLVACTSRWTIRGGLKRLLDKPWMEKTTVHQEFPSMKSFLALKTFEFPHLKQHNFSLFCSYSYYSTKSESYRNSNVQFLRVTTLYYGLGNC